MAAVHESSPFDRGQHHPVLVLAGAVAAAVCLLGSVSCSGGATYQRISLDGSQTDTPVGRDAAADSSGPRRPGEPTGQSCSAPDDCLSGFCFDGVCCATDCSGPCSSCASQGGVGICLPAEAGSDPR